MGWPASIFSHNPSAYHPNPLADGAGHPIHHMF